MVKKPNIYKITNLINGKIYVGRTAYVNKWYLGSGTAIKLAVKKYGKENFKKEVLEYCTEENIKEREIYWIEELNAKGKNGYNIADGGEGFTIGHSPWNVGIPHSEETKQKQSEAKLGKQLTEEHKKNIGIGHKGQVPWIKGRQHSDETKKKMKESAKKKVRTEEHNKNIGKAIKGRVPWNKGMKMDEEFKRKTSEGKKKANKLKKEL